MTVKKAIAEEAARYLEQQMWNINAELRENTRKMNGLANRQAALKRLRAPLGKLIHELRGKAKAK